MATIKAGLAGDFIYVATSAQAGSADLYTDSGWFTGAALGQGYVESAQGVTLSRSGNVFWVKFGNVWQSFDNLNLARKEFVRLVKAEVRADMEIGKMFAAV